MNNQPMQANPTVFTPAFMRFFVFILPLLSSAPVFGQSSALTVLLNGASLGGNAVTLPYNTDRANPSAFSGTPQLIQVRSTPPVNFTVTPVGSWLVYALVSPTATDCTGANYTSRQLTSTTPVGICIAATQGSTPILPGYYTGTLTLGATVGPPVTVPLQLNVFPTGYLQLTMPYSPNQQSFNGGALSYSLTGSAVSPAQSVHVNVFNNNSVNSTPYTDSNDQKEQLSISGMNSDGTNAAWLVTTLTNPTTGAPTQSSPALLNISVDPTLAPSGTQNISGTVSISSGGPFIGSDFVRVNVALPQAALTQFSAPSGPINFTSPGANSQSFTLASTGAPISFSAASDSPWLTVTPATGTTPQQITVTVNPSGLQPNVYTGTLTFSDTTGAATPLTIGVMLTVNSTSPVTRTIAHVADGNSFTTTWILSNPDTVNPSSYTIALFDEGGNPQTQGFQLAAGSGALSGNIPPGGQVVIRTQGLGTQTISGWATLTAAPQVGASVIYGQKIPSLPSIQEGTAVVPPLGINHFFLPFDNTNGAVTALALTNSSTAAANITVILRYTGGGSDTVSFTLPSRTHQAFALSAKFPTTGQAGHQNGVAEISSNIGIFAVAFRFNYTGGFTAFNVIPAATSAASITQIVPHAADGNAFTTTLILTNPDIMDPAPYTLRFDDNNGNPQTQAFALATGALSGTIPPGGSVTIATSGQGSQTISGWAELTAPSQVGANVIYGQKIPALPSLQEGTTLATATGTRHFFLPFDNSNGAVTSMALTNPGSAPAHIGVVLRYDAGGSDSTSFTLGSRSHQAFTLASQFPTTSQPGHQTGVAEFTSDVDVFPVAFRFNSTGAFTAFGINQQ
ncbi:MAG: hypothetical protein JO307_09950 [Bryobacterales bacterium]|nr:hypothetical protein [Bryobacterales bacterium]MBV9398424.1 hypothetical protein [Bryobacterales bacterium]